jgi:hypothetical protein
LTETSGPCLNSKNSSVLTLYQRHGFEEFGRTPNAAIDDDGKAEENI